jgi:hypothetical protein
MTALLVSLIFIVLAGAVLTMHGLEQRPTQPAAVRLPARQRR